MSDEREIDRHLGAVLNAVLDTLYQAKQAAWSASATPAQPRLQALVSYLIDQSGVLMEAEERIDGRAADIASPSSHQRGNIVAEAHGDMATVMTLLVRRLDVLAEDVRALAAAIPDAQEAPMLTDLAEGLEARTTPLRGA